LTAKVADFSVDGKGGGISPPLTVYIVVEGCGFYSKGTVAKATAVSRELSP